MDKFLKVGYISDLHLDSYFGYLVQDQGIYKPERIESLRNEIRFFIRKLFFKPSNTKKENEEFEVLAIAGDLSHQNKLTEEFMLILKEECPWIKYILIVFGNHCRYLIDYLEDGILFSSGEERIEDMRNKLSNIPGVYVLNGNIVEIEGIRFGGCDMWYDGSITKTFLETSTKTKLDLSFAINYLWCKSIADERYIKGIGSYNAYFKDEYKKLDHISENVDVLLTHVMPVTENRFINKKYKKIYSNLRYELNKFFNTTFKSNLNPVNGFFSFDGSKIIEKTTAKHWIFGHVHDMIKFKHKGINFYANQLGYSRESLNGKAAAIEMFKIKKSTIT